MSNQAVNIHLLGRPLKVSCPVGQEAALQQAVTELDQRLKNLSDRTKINNLEQLLIFTSLNLCNEINTQKNSLDDNTSLRLQLLSQTLDRALQNSAQRR